VPFLLKIDVHIDRQPLRDALGSVSVFCGDSFR
jgi:hypothetical protein